MPETVADLDLNYRPLPLELSSVTDLPKKKVRAKQLHVTIKYLGNVIVPRPAIFGLSRWGFLWFVSRSPGPAAPVTGSSLLLPVSPTPSPSFSWEARGFFKSTRCSSKKNIMCVYRLVPILFARYLYFMRKSFDYLPIPVFSRHLRTGYLLSLLVAIINNSFFDVHVFCSHS